DCGPPRSTAARVAAPRGGGFALGRPGGESRPPRSTAARVAAPRGGGFALGRPGGESFQSGAATRCARLPGRRVRPHYLRRGQPDARCLPYLGRRLRDRRDGALLGEGAKGRVDGL